MADIVHDFPITATAARIFEAISTPEGLDAWWTLEAAGTPGEGAEYLLGFGPEHQWRARMTRFRPPSELEYTLTRADADWSGTRVGFELIEQGSVTQVRFRHLGWPEVNEHYRVSCFCWAMYSRLLKHYLERGERVPYGERLDA